MTNRPSFQDPKKEPTRSRQSVPISTLNPIDRTRIVLFLAITFGLTLAPYLVIFLSNWRLNSLLEGHPMRLFLVALMFAPLLANIAARLITREGWSNTMLGISFRSGRWRYFLAAWLLPPIAAILGGVLYYLLFPAHFDPSMTFYRQQGLTLYGNQLQSLGYLLVQVAIAIVKPIWVTTLLFSFAEEIGWRAYLLPKLVPLGPRKAALLVGVIHGIWHWPSILILGSNYGSDYWGAPVSGPLLFVFSVTLTSVFYTWVTLRSGSVWPAAITHAAINTWNMLVCIFCTADQTPLIGPGSQGVIGMLGYALLALLIFFNSRSFAQAPFAPAETSVPINPAGAGKTAEMAKTGKT